MKPYSYLICALALILGLVAGKKIHKWHYESEKWLKVPLLENEFKNIDQIKETPMLLLIHLQEGDTGLRRSLQAIENQDYQNYEVLILDESASNESSEICREFLQRGQVMANIIRGSRAELLAKAHDKIATLSKNALVIPMRGRDWLPNDLVLKLLNVKQKELGYRLLLGQYILYPNYEQGIIKRKVKHAIKKGHFSRDETLLPCFKAFASELISGDEDLLALEEKEAFLALYNAADGAVFFSPFVLHVQNDLPPGENVLFDRWVDAE